MSEITIVSTEEKWVGYGFRSFSSVIEEMMSAAEKEIVMTVYVISDMKVVESVKNALERGISVEIFIYLQDSSQRCCSIDEIFKLSKEYRYLRIHTISDEVLHAKVLIVDGCNVLVGS
ncbi:endonuclease, partial [Candidatus Bathyarchaeota archaeon]